MATKKVYTDEQELEIAEKLQGVTSYEEQTTVLTALSKSMEKPYRSMVAKASTMAKAGLCEYIKKEYEARKVVAGIGEKAEIVEGIAENLGVDASVIETLEKANKTALITVYTFLNNQVVELFTTDAEQDAVDNEQEEITE